MVVRINAFQRNAFQNSAFQVSILAAIADTTVITKPVNCVMAGNQPLRYAQTEIDAKNPSISFKIKSKAAQVVRLSKEGSSFTVKTGSKGYD